MHRALAPLALLALLAAACGGSGSKEQEPPKTPEETAERFLSLWKERKYTEMYDFVSSEAKLNIAGDKFVERYEAITEEATITDLDYQLKPSASPGGAEQAYSITLHTAFFGDIAEENSMSLIQEQIPQPTTSEDKAPQTRKEWRIKWQPSLVFKELDDRSLVHFFTRVPRRGGIYNRNGQELAVDGSVAVIGIVKDLRPKGFEPGDTIGAFGLEGSMDSVLAGERGGLLATVTPEGSIARQIAEKPSVAGKDIQLTIDINVQKKTEAELGERVGSIVVMDPRDNAILALASFPRFDPNAFIRGLSAEEFSALSNDPRQPFLHRPLLATFPTGSVFKVVTLAAGLEKGGFSTSSTIHCPPVWTGLGEQFAQKNWQTVDRGYLTPAEGLMASCNPVFFELAKGADEHDEYALPNMARSFSFGNLTGIKGLEEAAGIVPDPKWKQDNIGEPWYRGDAVNMGIGQGFVTATPLQIANAYSAISVTGVLRKPLLIRKISELGGPLSQHFQAEVVNPLPISPDTLDTIRQGLGLVIHSSGGTSATAWAGSSVDAAGKSGTAEDIRFGANHVFFVAYANRSEPSILALAALETGESGSREAAPMIRNILEAYLGGALVNQP